MPLLTVKEVATRLQVKDKTVYAWAAQGKIPSLKLNGLLRFRQDEIDRWLESCRVEHRPPVTLLSKRHHRVQTNVDVLIERAKRDAYSARRGNHHSEPIPKGEFEWDS